MRRCKAGFIKNRESQTICQFGVSGVQLKQGEYDCARSARNCINAIVKGFVFIGITAITITVLQHGCVMTCCRRFFHITRLQLHGLKRRYQYEKAQPVFHEVKIHPIYSTTIDLRQLKRLPNVLRTNCICSRFPNFFKQRRNLLQMARLILMKSPAVLVRPLMVWRF